MITKETRLFRLAVSLVLTIALALGVVPVLNTAIPGSADYSAQAATKKLPMYIEGPIELGMFEKYQAKDSINEEEYNKKANFSFKTSNKKIATVSKKGVVIGKKYGTAKITITEKYKGKTRKGTFKVAIKKAIINATYKKKEIAWAVKCATKTFIPTEIKNMKRVYGGDAYIVDNGGRDTVWFKNRKAKYLFYSGNKKILTLKKNGKVTAVKKAGRVKIIIKEKYKKKIRNLGYVYVRIYAPKFKVAGKTINLKYYENINRESVESIDDYYDNTVLFGNDYSIYGSFSSEAVWLYITDKKSDIELIKKKAPIIKGYKVHKITGDYSGDQECRVVANKDEKVLTSRNKEHPGEIVTSGTGTRYVLAFDGTKKKPVKYLGYCTVKVEKGEVTGK